MSKALHQGCDCTMQGDETTSLVGSCFRPTGPGRKCGDPPTIRLEHGDRTRTLWRVGAADAGLYEGQNVGLVQQGNDLKVTWLDTPTGKTDELQRKARRAAQASRRHAGCAGPGRVGRAGRSEGFVPSRPRRLP